MTEMKDGFETSVNHLVTDWPPPDTMLLPPTGPSGPSRFGVS